MSQGVMPLIEAGAVVYRDASGIPTDPDEVENAFSPPAAFTSSCELTALQSNCTARFRPAQVNALVSEMLCLASTLAPTGHWDCEDVCNVSAAFLRWATDAGPGTLRDYVDLYETPTDLAFDDATHVLTYSGEDVTNAISLASLLGVSTDANNILTNGADGKPYLSANGISSSLCADLTAKDALADCLVSPVAGNMLSSDGSGLYARLQDGDYGDVTVSGSGTVITIDPDAVAAPELAATGVTAGSYRLADITVDADGRITSATKGTAGPGDFADGNYGDVTISGGGTVISLNAGAVAAPELASTGVTAGAYRLSNVTVGADGRVTAASNGDGNYGDITVSGGGTVMDINASGVAAGTYANATVTVAADGRVTAASAGAAGSAMAFFVSVSPVAGSGYTNADPVFPGPSVGGTYTVVNLGSIVLSNGSMFWKAQQGMPALVVGDQYVFKGVTGAIPDFNTADFYYVGAFTKV